MVRATMDDGWMITLPDEAATERLGSEIAPGLRPGDVIALYGGLGAGKTTLARAIIRAIVNEPELEVPSPTFTLVQTYELEPVAVAHFDLYRVEDSSELAELGFDDALRSGVVIVEWPERLGDDLPDDRLDIIFAEEGLDRRRVHLAGRGAWADRLERLRRLDQFLAKSGWRGCDRRHLQGDASSRRYERIALASREAVLMDMPPRPDGPPVRNGLPYSRIAHLAEDVRPFIAMAGALRAIGLSAPEILAADPEEGFLVLEDFGDATFGRLAAEGIDLDEPYRAAVDVLACLGKLGRTTSVPAAGGTTYVIPPYDRDALAIETGLVPDWLWPKVYGGAQPDPRIREDFSEIWSDLFTLVEAGSHGWTLRDYHSPNLIWLPERSGPARVGLLDFQDAVIGHPAYDLVSLLQDARLEVCEQREAAMLQRYCDLAAREDAAFDQAAFRTAYAVLGAQRASKILGIFVRLAERDGKPHYLRHLRRVSRYLERNLANPALASLRDWYDRYLPPGLREAPAVSHHS